MNSRAATNGATKTISKAGEIVQTLCSVRDAIYDTTGSALLAGEKCKADDKQIIYQRLCAAGGEVTCAIELVQEHDIDLRSKLALVAEDSMGDQEVADILRSIVAAEDDFTKTTGLKCNDALREAIERARQWIANA